MDDEKTRQRDEVKRKITQVFRYLEALNQLRNPVQREINRQPWTLWLHDIPQHPAVERGPDVMDGEAAIFALKVRRPQLTRAPEPPDALVGWIKPGWEHPTDKVMVHSTRTLVDNKGRPFESAFSDDPDRPLLLRRWLTNWEAWAERERPARQVMTVFESLFALQAQLERESERVELVLGEGLLTWNRTTSDQIHHPVLIQRLRLEFNPDVPEFVLSESEHPPELYSALLRALPDVNPSAIGRIREDLDANQWSLMGDEDTSSFLRRLVSQLNVRGRFHENRDEQPEGTEPLIVRDPVLFLRHRTLGFAVALESILADLQTRDEIPESLSKIVGIDPASAKGNDDEAGAPQNESFNGEDEAVLLTKLANSEQLQIAQRLDRYGAVLVQGPPGTGKTHTIANLLGHLLAQGKSVLVTSHTAKALKVLKEKVVEPLQPLCVSAVEDGSADLESTVDVITERLGSYSADTLKQEAAKLERERLALLNELRQARRELRLARTDEYRPVVVAGQEHSPSQAARLVAGQEDSAWIPGPVRLGDPLPLSVTEVLDLYATNQVVTTEDERELTGSLPDPADLPLPSAFGEMVSALGELSYQNLEFRRDLWGIIPDGQTPDDLNSLYQRLLEALGPIQEQQGWQLSIIAAGRQGRSFREVWLELLSEIDQVNQLAAETQITVARLGPELPRGLSTKNAITVLDGILTHLRNGKGFGRFHLLINREWKRFIESARVNDEPPRELEQFEALLTIAHMEIARQRLIARWQRQVTAIGGPDVVGLGTPPEFICQQYSNIIRRCLNWYEQTWSPLESALVRQGLRWDLLLEEAPVNPAPNGDLLRLSTALTELLPPVLKAQSGRLISRKLHHQLAETDWGSPPSRNSTSPIY